MSRIGKLPITIPENVDVNCNESEIIVKGKFGTLQTKIPDILPFTQMKII
jgi:ribosomal protein L6P/L9E